MTDPNADDRNAADTQYHNAVETAKAEFNLLEPEFRKMQSRIAQLKLFIGSGSRLLGIDVDEKYDYKPGHTFELHRKHR